MSAYLCEDEYFIQLAAWLVNDDQSSLQWLGDQTGYQFEFGRRGYVDQDKLATHLANLLKQGNAYSLECRYNGRHDWPGINDPVTVSLGEVDRCGRIDLAAIAKMLDCYEYQACEPTDWEQTKPCWLVQYARKELGRRLPGYRDVEAPVQFDKPASNIVNLMSLVP